MTVDTSRGRPFLESRRPRADQGGALIPMRIIAQPILGGPANQNGLFGHYLQAA